MSTRLLALASLLMLGACAAAPYRDVALDTDLQQDDLAHYRRLSKGTFGSRTIEDSRTGLPLRLIAGARHQATATRDPHGRLWFSIEHRSDVLLGLLGGAIADTHYNWKGGLHESRAGWHAPLGVVSDESVTWSSEALAEEFGRTSPPRQRNELSILWGLYCYERDVDGATHSLFLIPIWSE